MAGASLIRRETTMSAVSISRPVVFSPRPYSSRIQSARLVLSQSRDLTTNRGYITDEVFPDIQSLSISHASGSLRTVEANQALKESTFPNFRLLQQLAASAKARISSNSLSNQIIQPSQEDEISKWNSIILHSTEDPTNDSANITLPSRIEPPLPPANAMKDINGTYKVHRTKPQKRQSKFKSKKPGKQLSHTKRHGGKTTFNHLQPSTSKVFPTFSQRFTKQRRSNNQARDKRTSNTSPSSDGSSALQFSLAVYPEYQSNQSSHSDLQNAFSKGDLRQHGSNSIQEAKLRAIYDTSELGATVSATSDSLNRVRLKKVFQSEKQSGYMTQCGRLLPCAPPTSPTPLVLDKYEIIPSLADLRSQQSIKQRLNALEKENKKKRQAEDQEKKRKERQLLQTQFEAQRVRTRQEIYALNKIMTKLEKEHFKRFQEKMKNR